MSQGKSEVVLSTDTPQDDKQQANQGQPAGDQGQPKGDQGQQQEGQYGGFNTVEELVAAYQQAKAGGEKPQGTPGQIEEGDDAGDQAVSNALKAAGLDQDVFTKEFGETGTLSDESFKSLEAKGFSRDMVDVYLDGLRARQEAYSAAVFAPAGGQKGYTDLLGWAKSNLTADEKRAFNEAVASGDPSRAALAVQGVVAKRGGRGQMLNGKTAPNADAGPKPFESNAQVVEAMRDPRYRRDAAYRKEVAERLRVSNVFK